MSKKKEVSMLQMVLIVLYVCSYMIANIITAKQVQFPFGITMTGAVFIFPITYILSDVFSEVYGYKWSRITCYLAFIFQVFMTLIFAATIATPAPSYWGNQEAYEIVLGGTPRILAASFTAFVLGDFINDKVFKKFKEKHPNDHKGFGFRAILSSFCGELVDSFIFLPLAFLGTMPLENLWAMTLIQVFIKTGYEVVILPITRIVVKKISKNEARYLSI